MMVTRNDGFTYISPPRIERDVFVSLYEGLGSPAAPDSRAGYDALIAYGVEPSFAFAIHEHESELSTNPNSVNVRYNNHNPGNIRNPPPNAAVVQTDRGPFLTFPNWLEGFNALGIHLSSDLYRGLTIAEAIYKWAPSADGNDPESYITAVVDTMNSVASPQKGEKAMRVILSAGHLNIGDITADKGIDPAALRGATGALGTEAQPNEAVVQRAAAILASHAVDVVTTDAIYHADVYNSDADLCVFVHHDGVGFASDQPQRSGATVVHSGPSTIEVDSEAGRFVDIWKRVSPQVTGITNTDTSTNDMLQYYGGWYRTANTPAAIVECSIWGGSDGQRNDVDTNKEGDALASAIMEYGGINVSTSGSGSGATGSGNPSTQPTVAGASSDTQRGSSGDSGSAGSRNNNEYTFYNATGHGVGFGFRQYVLNSHPDYTRSDAESGHPHPFLGFPLTEEFTMSYPIVNGGVPTTVQYWERGRLERHIRDDGTDEVMLGRLGAEQMDVLPRGLLPK